MTRKAPYGISAARTASQGGPGIRGEPMARRALFCLFTVASVAMSQEARATVTLSAVGNVYAVAQGAGSEAPVSTEQRWNLSGMDEGSAFSDYTCTNVLLYGDSYGYDGNPFLDGMPVGSPNSDWRHSVFARST